MVVVNFLPRKNIEIRVWGDRYANLACVLVTHSSGEDQTELHTNIWAKWLRSSRHMAENCSPFLCLSEPNWRKLRWQVKRRLPLPTGSVVSFHWMYIMQSVRKECACVSVCAANVFTCIPKYRRRYFRGMCASLRRILKANLRRKVGLSPKAHQVFDFLHWWYFFHSAPGKIFFILCVHSHGSILLFE